MSQPKAYNLERQIIVAIIVGSYCQTKNMKLVANKLLKLKIQESVMMEKTGSFKPPFVEAYALQSYLTAEEGIIEANKYHYDYWYVDGSLESEMPLMWNEQRIENLCLFSNNNGQHDQHLSLSRGNINYNEVIGSVNAVGWKGIIAFETRDISPSKSIEELVNIHHALSGSQYIQEAGMR